MNLGEAPAAVPLQLPVQQTAAPDPLGIDELMAASEIKVEPSQIQVEQGAESSYLENQLGVIFSWYMNGRAKFSLFFSFQVIRIYFVKAKFHSRFNCILNKFFKAVFHWHT